MDLSSITLFYLVKWKKNGQFCENGKKEKKQKNKMMEKCREAEWENKSKEEI